MTLVDILHSITTGPKRRRMILTPIVLTAVLSILIAAIFGSLALDKVIGMSEFISSQLGLAIGVPLMLIGFALYIWCLVWFRKAKGTPVPTNPPEQLITKGPYAVTRNPMVSGISIFLLGLGFLLNSVSITFVLTPLFILVNTISFVVMEEPELERRFGEDYREYKRKVPRFVPRIRGGR